MYKKLLASVAAAALTQLAAAELQVVAFSDGTCSNYINQWVNPQDKSFPVAPAPCWWINPSANSFRYDTDDGNYWDGCYLQMFTSGDCTTGAVTEFKTAGVCQWVDTGINSFQVACE